MVQFSIGSYFFFRHDFLLAVLSIKRNTYLESGHGRLYNLNLKKPPVYTSLCLLQSVYREIYLFICVQVRARTCTLLQPGNVKEISTLSGPRFSSKYLTDYLGHGWFKVPESIVIGEFHVKYLPTKKKGYRIITEVKICLLYVKVIFYMGCTCILRP